MFDFTNIREPRAGQTTYEVTVYITEGGHWRVEVSLADLPAAIMFALGVLRAKTARVVKWRHERNLPNALPPVRAYSLAMWTAVGDNDCGYALQQHNIF
jgi:hypothetical protein